MTPTPVATATRIEHPLTGPVLCIWRDVLDIDAGLVEVDPRANFFDLGGDALQALLVVSRVSTEFGVDLPLSTLFDYPTPSEFAAALAVHVDSADRDRRSDR